MPLKQDAEIGAIASILRQEFISSFILQCGVKSLHPPLLARTLQGMKIAQLESQGSENTYILAR
jgi:hypothetical protein